MDMHMEMLWGMPRDAQEEVQEFAHGDALGNAQEEVQGKT